MTRRSETTALYVRLPAEEAEKLDRAAFELKAHKRDLVAALVARHVDPTSAEGLQELRELGVETRSLHRGEIPLPPSPRPPHREPEREEPARPQPPLVFVGRAGEWVAGLQRAVRDFLRSRERSMPFVLVTLEDGEQLFVETLSAGPGESFVTVSAHAVDEGNRLLVLHLDAVRRVEILERPPNSADERFRFRPRELDFGFTRSG